jgi:hypothetical protein
MVNTCQKPVLNRLFCLWKPLDFNNSNRIRQKIKKGKFVPVLLTEHHAVKAYWGSGGIASLVL